MALLRRTAKDFDALKSAMLAALPELAPAWTNLNEGDLGMALINLMAGTSDMLAYYIDRQADEVFLPTAITRDSVMKLARLIDYKLSRPVAAKTTLRFSLLAPALGDIAIPRYVQVKTADGTTFTTKDEATLFAGQTFVDVEAYQGAFVTDLFSATGADTQNFPLAKPDVAQNFVDVLVGNQAWTEDTALVSPKERTVYEVLTDVDERAVLRFSRFLGDVPPQNSAVQVNYIATRGAAGNIGKNLVTTIVTQLAGGEGLGVTNTTVAAGGKDRESIDEARVNAPRQLRTLNRAVTLQDYVDLLETFPKVAKAQAINHNGYVECYVAPEAGARFFIPAPSFTLTTSPNPASTLDDATYYVGITAVDEHGGETTTWDYTPADRAVVSQVRALATGDVGQQLTAHVTNVSGTVSYNVYVGPSAGALAFLKNVEADAGASTDIGISAEPTSTAAPPASNTTGERAQSGAESLKTATERFLDDRRTIGTTFALFNAGYVPVNVTATVKLYDNYSQTAVKGAVHSALAQFFAFDRQAFGEDVTLSGLYTTIMDVAGVRSVTLVAPAADVPVNNGQLATLGVTTLTMQGGVA